MYSVNWAEHHIQLRSDAKPVVHSARRVPFRLQSQFKAQLEEMEGNQLITKVTEPTEWVNPLVTVMKSDQSLRICLDPGSLNAAIKREHCYTNNFAQGISVHLTQHQASCKSHRTKRVRTYLTTFATPFGRY